MMSSSSRSQVGCLLLMILLSVSVLRDGVLGGRYVKVTLVDEYVLQSPPCWRKSCINNNETDGDGGSYSFETVHREVPSSPDPLHNR
ncbi:hypothetical protein HN51_014664 [Arachis hypogaea]